MGGPASGLRDHVGYWLRRLSDEVHLSFERKLTAHGVTVAQWNVLVTLYRGKGQTVAEVARFTEADAAAVSRLVDRLAEKGLVARSADPASRRRVLLTLTPPAAALVPALVQLADQNDEEFFGTLPPAQRAELAGLLQRLLSQARAPGRGNRDKENESLHHRDREPPGSAGPCHVHPPEGRGIPRAGESAAPGRRAPQRVVPARRPERLRHRPRPGRPARGPLATGSLPIPPSDRDALIGALRADQAGMTTLAEFLGAAWRAGVLRYVADFDAREVTYYGWNGDSYVESYPDAAIEQP